MKPKSPVLTASVRFNATIGSESKVTFTCKTSSVGDSVTYIFVRKYQSGNTPSQPPIYTVSSSNMSNQFVVERASTNESGIYFCIAEMDGVQSDLSPHFPIHVIGKFNFLLSAINLGIVFKE